MGIHMCVGVYAKDRRGRRKLVGKKWVDLLPPMSRSNEGDKKWWSFPMAEGHGSVNKELFERLRDIAVAADPTLRRD